MSEFCKVKNRSAGVTVYNIPDEGIRRSFMPGEEKTISYKELEQLTYQPGGMNILTKFLQIMDVDTVKSFNMKVEPEYFMSEQDIIRVMKTGSLNEFLDTLDFAPNGVIDLIKKLSTSLPLEDMNKREALKKKTGFDVEAALRNMRADQEDETKVENIDESAAPKRRVQKEEGRRASTPKYTVVTPKENISKETAAE